MPSTFANLPGTAVVVIAAIAVAAALHLAAVAAIPIVASLLLCLLLWPLRSALARRMPSVVAAAACSLLIGLALALFVGAATYAGARAVEQFRSSSERYVQQYQSARSWLVGIGVPESTVPRFDADTTNPDAKADDTARRPQHGDTPETERRTAQKGIGEPLSVGTRRQLAAVVLGGLRSAAGVVAALLLTVFLTFLALSEGHHAAGWWQQRLSPERARLLADLVATWSSQMRWYFIGKTGSGLVSGVATGLWLWAMGVPMALTWALLTFLMNYVPNIGVLISALPPVLLAVAELGWTQALIVAAGLLAIESLVGNLLDPYFQGRALTISTWTVLASLVFWGWMWGVVGAVLAPVLTAAILAMIDHGLGVHDPSADGEATSADNDAHRTQPK